MEIFIEAMENIPLSDTSLSDIQYLAK